ncbi:MAG: hypothetical protein ACRYFS_26365 [Janthinobacterium lividum]
MRTDDSTSSAEAGRGNVQSWPLPESEVADAEAILMRVHEMIAQIEQTINRAKAYLAELDANESVLREMLTSSEPEKDCPPLSNLQAARGLRAELVKASQQSVTVSQAAAKYLQARERFIIARRDWTTQGGDQSPQ